MFSLLLRCLFLTCIPVFKWHKCICSCALFPEAVLGLRGQAATGHFCDSMLDERVRIWGLQVTVR